MPFMACWHVQFKCKMLYYYLKKNLTKEVRLWSHRSIRYTVFAISYTICSPPQTRFRRFLATSLECCLSRRANRIAYTVYLYVITALRFLSWKWFLLFSLFFSVNFYLDILKIQLTFPSDVLHCKLYSYIWVDFLSRVVHI